MASRTLIFSWRLVAWRQTPTRSLSWRVWTSGSQPEDADAAAGAGAQALEDFDGGGFAGAVGAEQAEDFAGAHFEIDAFDGLERAVGLFEAFYLNGMIHGRVQSLTRVRAGRRKGSPKAASGERTTMGR